MYDSDKLPSAGGGHDAARSGQHLAGDRHHLDGSALMWRPAAMRDFHPMAFAAALALRTPAIGLWRRFVKEFFQSYRPELHYMRGPGPKWRAKHRGPGAR